MITSSLSLGRLGGESDLDLDLDLDGEGESLYLLLLTGLGDLPLAGGESTLGRTRRGGDLDGEEYLLRLGGGEGEGDCRLRTGEGERE